MFVDWRDKILQNCVGRWKNQNGYISCSAVCPFKSGKNIFFVKRFEFWVILSGEFSVLVSVWAKLIYITFLTHMFVNGVGLDQRLDVSV